MSAALDAFSSEELVRYSRHLMLPNIGIDDQHRLKQAKIGVIGAGGLAHPALQYLTAAGIGHISIVDADSVERSNLQRQVLFGAQDIGSQKVTAVIRSLQRQNPYVTFVAHHEMLVDQNAASLLSGHDLIIDATDNFATRYLINDVCQKLSIPVVFASIAAFEGQCSIFCAPSGPCYRCLYPSPPPADLMPNCAEGGVLGILPGLLGVIQASEAIKYLLQMGQPLVGHLLTVNVLTMRFQQFPLSQQSGCVLCGHGQMPTSQQAMKCQQPEVSDHSVTAQELFMLQQQTDIFLLDVREPYEAKICQLEQSYLIPLAELDNRLEEVDQSKTIIVYCKTGVRSAKAVKLLALHGILAKNLQGGVLSWRRQINPELLLY